MFFFTKVEHRSFIKFVSVIKVYLCRMMKPIISVKNLVKHYDSFQAVKGISFDVYPGEIFGLLGPNGAGKTTTLEILETLRPKTSGEVMVNDWVVGTHNNEIKKIIGVQLQAAGYYPNLTLIELIDLFSGLYGRAVDSDQLLQKVGLTDKAKSKYPYTLPLSEVLERADLLEKRKALVRQLSGGQRQRLYFALAIVGDPDLIFLDEPTTGLDPQARRNLWELIRQIRDEGTTVVLTTHYMDEAEELCNRVAIIENGSIIALDTPDKLIDNLVASGFERKKEVKKANLEDVFLNLTGQEWRE